MKGLLNRIGREAVAAVKKNSTGTAAQVAARAYQPAAWQKDLKAAVKTPLAGIIRYGASRELQLAKPRRKSEIAFLLRAPGMLSKQTRIPPEVKDALDAFLDGLLDQPYWDDVLDSVRDSLVVAMKAGLDAGESGDQLAARVEDVMGGAANEVRARRIARTEATGALNAGAEAARQPLYDAGLLAGREWLAVVDGDTRPDHEEANGQVAAPGEPFTVGEEDCDYPGDVELSAAQRCNCRCATVSIPADDVEDDKAVRALAWYKGWAA